MSDRLYLQTTGGGKYEKTETGCRPIAEAVFKTVLERDELDGKSVRLYLVPMRTTLAAHRFDKAAGDAENGQGREDEILGPEGTGHVVRPANWKGRAQKCVSGCRRPCQGSETWEGELQFRTQNRFDPRLI